MNVKAQTGTTLAMQLHDPRSVLQDRRGRVLALSIAPADDTVQSIVSKC